MKPARVIDGASLMAIHMSTWGTKVKPGILVMHEKAAVWSMTDKSQPANSQVSSHIHIKVTTILTVNTDAASAAA